MWDVQRWVVQSSVPTALEYCLVKWRCGCGAFGNWAWIATVFYLTLPRAVFCFFIAPNVFAKIQYEQYRSDRYPNLSRQILAVFELLTFRFTGTGAIKNRILQQEPEGRQNSPHSPRHGLLYFHIPPNKLLRQRNSPSGLDQTRRMTEPTERTHNCNHSYNYQQRLRFVFRKARLHNAPSFGGRDIPNSCTHGFVLSQVEAVLSVHGAGIGQNDLSQHLTVPVLHQDSSEIDIRRPQAPQHLPSSVPRSARTTQGHSDAR